MSSSSNKKSKSKVIKLKDIKPSWKICSKRLVEDCYIIGDKSLFNTGRTCKNCLVESNRLYNEKARKKIKEYDEMMASKSKSKSKKK